MNYPNELPNGKSKYHQSPNHLQKKQELNANATAKEILSQIPGRNLRNPDYYITSILANANSKVFLQKKINL